MANGNEETSSVGQKGELAIFFIVTCTVCLLAIGCVLVQGLCVLYKIPDMNTTLSNAFMHTADTVIGGVLGWAAKSGVQRLSKKAEIVNDPEHPVPTKAQP